MIINPGTKAFMRRTELIQSGSRTGLIQSGSSPAHLRLRRTGVTDWIDPVRLIVFWFIPAHPMIPSTSPFRLGSLSEFLNHSGASDPKTAFGSTHPPIFQALKFIASDEFQPEQSNK